jgi:biotin-(acetyl-CoA carboxylase) ligase
MSKVESAEVREVATSLAALVGQTLSREEVLASFCNELEDLLALSFDGVLECYRKVDLLAGQKVWVMPKKRENPERKAAQVLDLAADGNLVVQLEETGEIVSLIGEEVSIRVQ